VTKKVIWSPAAEEDLKNILIYLLDKWSQNVAIKFLNKVDTSVLLISEEPKIFPLINKKHRVRKCVLTRQNTIFYREHKDKIDIIRIFDTRQDPGRLKF